MIGLQMPFISKGPNMVTLSGDKFYTMISILLIILTSLNATTKTLECKAVQCVATTLCVVWW